MSERRGSKFLKGLDQYIGNLLLLALVILMFAKRVFIDSVHQALRAPSKIEQNNPNVGPCLLICLGAIGDLILLTEAAKTQLNGRRIFLACSASNIACAQLYRDLYAGIELINVRSLTSVHSICKKYGIVTIFDSTQWANIGPILTGIARLLNNGLTTYGFITANYLRNNSYSHVVNHLSNRHEVCNFADLLNPFEVRLANYDLEKLLPWIYSKKPIKKSKKILFHMWPSGARSYLKEWPESSWLNLTNFFSKLGYKIYLSGSPSDFIRNQKFINASQLPLVNIAGVYDLGQLSDFIASDIEFAVSVNTGILHLAACLGTPVIGLHGPTNPNRWGPLGLRSVALLPKSGLFSYLNYGFEYPKDDRSAYSLDRLDVDQVIQAFERLIDAKS